WHELPRAVQQLVGRQRAQGPDPALIRSPPPSARERACVIQPGIAIVTASVSGEADMAKLTRRGALGALGAMLGSSATGGCGLGGDLRAKLPDPDPTTPLTIDVHSHVFNLSDTQFRDFVKHAHPDQAAIVDMLGDL